ncbi:MAG: urea ABC transporter permease subunit UrtB [Granulosicoccus sp.]|nr:urea ABC transporter permease subunit UrtB [Granulosicoccus sp.]
MPESLSASKLGCLVDERLGKSTILIKIKQGLRQGGIALALLTGLLIGFGIFSGALAQSDEQALEQVLPELLVKSFKKKTLAAERIAQTADHRSVKLLEAMLGGRLGYIKEGKSIVYMEKVDGGLRVTDVLTEQLAGTLKKNQVKKIVVNNKLRKALRVLIAKAQLADKDPGVRKESVLQMLGTADDVAVEALKTQIEIEPDKDIRQLIQVAIDLNTIQSNPGQSLQEVQRLSTRLEPKVRNALAEISSSSSLKESDPDVVEAAIAGLKKIDGKVSFYKRIETAFFGLSLGSVLVLAAIGLAITFGVMGVINMAHGELIMIGAYTTYTMQQLMPTQVGLALLLSIPAAFLVSALVGMLIERGIIRHLYGRPLETLLATFGVSLVLQQLVRSIYSPLNRSVESPSWLSGTLEINSVLSLTLNRLYIIAFCLVVFAALYFLINRSNVGLHVRAISQNRQMARAMGIRASRVDMLTFGLGSGIAGIAGVALSQLTNVGPNLGQGYIIDSFLVVVFGGVGNLWGTLVSGFTLGIANKFLEPWSGAVLAKILVLVFIILFIQKYPSGLFPQRGRAAEA